MSFRGVLTFIAMSLLYSSFAQARECRSLFAKSSDHPTIQRIEVQTKNSFDKTFSDIVFRLNLSEEAKVLGKNLIKTSRFFTDYTNQLEIKNKTLSSEQTLELGEHLMERALVFADAAHIQYKTLSYTIGDKKRKIIQILPEGTHPLNVEAAKLSEYETRLIYNPYELLINNAAALFESKLANREFYISESILVSGRITKNPDGVHELTHVRIEDMRSKNIPYLFYGNVVALKGLLPGQKGGYDKEMHFEEIDAYMDSVHMSLSEMIELNPHKTKLSKESVAALNAIYMTQLESNLTQGLIAAERVELVTAQSINALAKDSSPVAFKLHDGVYTARWQISTRTSQYNVEIPFAFNSKELSRDELLNKLATHLQQSMWAAIYFKNLYSKGLKIHSEMSESSYVKRTPVLIDYQKSLIRKYKFSSAEDAQMQKNL